MRLKLQHHSVTLITLLREMVTCSMFFCTRMSDCQKSLSQTFWNQITYQYFPTYWLMLEIGIFRTRLTKSQFGTGIKACPLPQVVSTLSWWWGLCDSVTRRAMPAVVELPAGPPMPVRSRGRVQTKRDTLVLQYGGWAWG
jgi:hypothetical protein